MKKVKPPIPTVINRREVMSVGITKVYDKSTSNNGVELDYSNTRAVANSVYDKITNNEEILRLFPDVELSIQILVSSIMSPNDLISSKLNYSLDDADIPNDINSRILDTISRHVGKNYKLEDKLPTILREALFTKGAYAEAIVSDVDISNIQQRMRKVVSTESHRPIEADTFLGKKFKDVKLSIESDIVDSGTLDLTVTSENLGIEYSEDMSILVESTMSAETNLSTESGMAAITTKLSLNSFMRKKKQAGGVISLTTDNSVGSPMVMKLPVGSVIPIHTSNDPSKHVSYLVLLDEHGAPVSKITTNSNPTGSSEIRSDTLDIKTTLISKAANALKTKLKDSVKLKGVDEFYTKALMADIKSKVSNGPLGNAVSIPEYSDAYNIVFTRAMKGLKTRLLYIPKANMNYFAFEYRENGTGMSLLEKSVMLFSIRATNLFTRIMANVKNSVRTTKVTAQLDETDPDPEHTRELIINATMKSEKSKYPIGMTNVNDLVDWMHNVGYRFDIKHPKLPDISMDVSDETRDINTIDESFDEMIQEHIIMSFGLKIDMVRSGYEADFATSIVANNVLLAKRVMTYQKQFNPQLSKYVKSVMSNDGILKAKVLDIVTANITPIRKMLVKGLTKEELVLYNDEIGDDAVLAEYVYNLYTNDTMVTLPGVDISSEDGSMDGLSNFVDMLDTYLPMIISDETLPLELVGDLSDKMVDITAAIKTVLIKNWIDEHNYLPEVSKFFTLDNTGKPRYDILEEYSEFTKVIAKVVIPHLKKLKKASNKTDDVLDKIENGVEDTPVADETSGTSDNNTNVDDGSGIDTTAFDT